MGDARKHNTHNALFFEHNPADPLTFCFRDRGEGRFNFMKPDFFPYLQVLHDYSEWAINCARIFLKSNT